MKKIYLVQRGKIRRPLIAGGTLSDAVEFEYMGASEFEAAPLPMPISLRALHEVSAELRFVRFPVVKRVDDVELFGYGCFGGWELEEYAENLAAVAGVTAGEGRTLEPTNFRQALRTDLVPPSMRTPAAREACLANRTSFWWDLQNHVIMSFCPEFMAALPGLLAQSWAKLSLPAANQPCVFDATTATTPVTTV